ASDGDEQDKAWRRPSRHADQHEQSRIHVERSEPRRGSYRFDATMCVVAPS
ncbi:hypothetical protein EJ04DRAFT_9075, partial [Polyplosphaeria fusca]